MAVALRHSAVVPSKETAEKRMPKGPGVHLKVIRRSFSQRPLFDGERKNPVPSPDREEDDRPTYAPKPGETRALHQEELRLLTRNDIENDDLPTYGPSKKATPSPPPERPKEENLLNPLSAEARQTKSFAPPPSVTLPDIGEVSKLEQKGTAHKVIAKWKPKKKGEPGKDGWAMGESLFLERP